LCVQKGKAIKCLFDIENRVLEVVAPGLHVNVRYNIFLAHGSRFEGYILYTQGRFFAPRNTEIEFSIGVRYI
jgi:hypothetical protein